MNKISIRKARNISVSKSLQETQRFLKHSQYVTFRKFEELTPGQQNKVNKGIRVQRHLDSTRIQNLDTIAHLTFKNGVKRQLLYNKNEGSTVSYIKNIIRNAKATTPEKLEQKLYNLEAQLNFSLVKNKKDFQNKFQVREVQVYTQPYLDKGGNKAYSGVVNVANHLYPWINKKIVAKGDIDENKVVALTKGGLSLPNIKLHQETRDLNQIISAIRTHLNNLVNGVNAKNGFQVYKENNLNNDGTASSSDYTETNLFDEQNDLVAVLRQKILEYKNSQFVSPAYIKKLENFVDVVVLGKSLLENPIAISTWYNDILLPFYDKNIQYFKGQHKRLYSKQDIKNLREQ